MDFPLVIVPRPQYPNYRSANSVRGAVIIVEHAAKPWAAMYSPFIRSNTRHSLVERTKRLAVALKLEERDGTRPSSLIRTYAPILVPLATFILVRLPFATQQCQIRSELLQPNKYHRNAVTECPTHRVARRSGVYFASCGLNTGGRSGA